MSAHADPWRGRHPKDRAIEPEDPMQLVAEPVPGDPAMMLDGIVEEYARLGWDFDHILRIFDTPFFQATWGLRRLYGERELHARIAATLSRCGVMRFRTQWNPEAAADARATDVPDHLACPPGPTPRGARSGAPHDGARDA
jgi:hypothetical protein